MQSRFKYVSSPALRFSKNAADLWSVTSLLALAGRGGKEDSRWPFTFTYALRTL